jgi:hypothetical protein
MAASSIFVVLNATRPILREDASRPGGAAGARRARLGNASARDRRLDEPIF